MTRATWQSWARAVIGVAAGGLIAAVLCAAPDVATAAGARAGWAIDSVGEPENFALADTPTCELEDPFNSPLGFDPCDSYRVFVRNVGSVATNGVVRISDVLPHAVGVMDVSGEAQQPGEFNESLECSASPVECTYSQPVKPGGVLIVRINVVVKTTAVEEVANEATVEGAEAPPVTTSSATSQPNTINGSEAAFAINDFSVRVDGADGSRDAEAGGHPYGVTTTFGIPSRLEHAAGEARALPIEEPKDVVVDLPLGLVGNPQAAPQCPLADLVKNAFESACPKASRVGLVTFEGEGGARTSEVTELATSAVYNMVPERGYPAEFGFSYLGHPVFTYATVAHGSEGYGLRVVVPGLLGVELNSVSLTIFGDPATEDGGSTSAKPFFTNPVQCTGGPLSVSVEANSWEQPRRWVSSTATAYDEISGCGMLQFAPTLTVLPEVNQVDKPSGYEVHLVLPQHEDTVGRATAELRNATITLPEGVAISPGAASGLAGCNPSGPESIEIPEGVRHPDEAGQGESIGADGLSHLTPGHCPKASTLGTVEVVTPLLADPLKGNLFLAQPRCGGEGQPVCTEASATNGELFGLYLEAQGSGVVVKLKGSVSANPTTGQLTATFSENPQLPFGELKVRLNGGPTSPLANPQGCGEARTTSDLTPWSAPFTADATPSSSFEVTGCGASMPFGPSFVAGTITPIGGGFSPFTLTLARRDGEQDLSTITLTTPPGLLGILSQVQLCQEPQASQGTCGPQSLIGHTQVAAGAGSHPFWVPGEVFLTGPYRGAPFGLTILTHAQAGPFNLGNVIVRATIHVDPHTSALTVVSDPLPRIIDGVPLRIQTVNVAIDRPGFMFNPTNCSQQQITGTITAAQGASANVASPFAVAGCKNLPFKPGFTVLTQAKTSKANGASLHVKVTQKPGEANIRKVDLQLPLALPSRLTTLQKACSEAQFNANPAGCPAGSVIGTATAHTPVLQEPLTGPAYLVSHGGAAFPDVEFILQADERGGNVEIVLDGKTQIKKGITYSHFETVPDAPISSFETNLPEGAHSALSANGNLCTQSLVMPTTIVGQNGTQVTQRTKISVTGCKAVAITKRKLSGTQVVLTFFLTTNGTVTITGRGLKSYRKTLGAGSHQIKLALSNAGLSARRHHKKIKIKVALTTGSKVSSATTTLKL
jgi:hypothetical protein